jgi:hypothetical protein
LASDPVILGVSRGGDNAEIADCQFAAPSLSEEMPTLYRRALQGLQKLSFAFILCVYGYPGRSFRVFVSPSFFERSPEI